MSLGVVNPTGLPIVRTNAAGACSKLQPLSSDSIANGWKLPHHSKEIADMIDPKDPLKDGVTPPDHGEYGDVPDSAEGTDTDERGDVKNEPNPGESPLG